MQMKRYRATNRLGVPFAFCDVVMRCVRVCVLSVELPCVATRVLGRGASQSLRLRVGGAARHDRGGAAASAE